MDKDFGQRVRAERAKRGWTQQDLAERAGVSRMTVKSVEEGSMRVRASAHAAISAALDLGPDLELVIFGVLADHTSDMDWLDEVGAKLADALRKSGLLRGGV